jgi:SAM-dependent methyltransferase
MTPNEISTCLSCGTPLRPLLPRVVDPQSTEVFRIDVCPACDLGQTLPQPDDLRPYYGERYYGQRHSLTKQFYLRRRKRFIASIQKKPARLLDAGCGDGGFIEAMQHDGWTVTGTELNPQRVRDRGFQVFDRIAESVERGPFECVTFWHTLEHFKNPIDALHDARTVIAKDGTLFIAVPNRGGLQAKAFGSKWLHLDVPRHLFHFSQKSLTRALNTCGFEPVSWWFQEFEIDLFGVIQSTLNHLMPTPNTLFDMLLRQPTVATGVEKAANLLLAPTVTAASLPLWGLGVAMQAGGTLVVAARPK